VNEPAAATLLREQVARPLAVSGEDSDGVD
jgi:hypothetical protein